jgi:hypothetical protein
MIYPQLWRFKHILRNLLFIIDKRLFEVKRQRNYLRHLSFELYNLTIRTAKYEQSNQMHIEKLFVKQPFLHKCFEGNSLEKQSYYAYYFVFIFQKH